MSDIPEAYLRVRERRVEKIVKRHLSTVSSLSSWLIGELFTAAELNSIESAELHVDLDHRAESGDPLAYGETDIEIIATVMLPNNRILRVGLLIEMKVDARQMEKQGLRYRARAAYRKQIGSWDAFQCILVAPKRYLENAYPMDDFHETGWDRLVALQDVARVLNGIDGASEDAIVLNQATDATNSWNQPIPAAVEFYSDLSLFQRVVYSDVPISINRQRGAGVSVWPSFFENQLAKIETQSDVSVFRLSTQAKLTSRCISRRCSSKNSNSSSAVSWKTVLMLVRPERPGKALESKFLTSIPSCHWMNRPRTWIKYF